MSVNAKRQVVLATYNGDQFLSQQLDSVMSQLVEGDELVVHDDGSTDGTRALLSDFAVRDGDRVRLLAYPPTGGPKANFSSLLGRTSAQYVYCADQDDIWLPGKLDRLEQVLKFYEDVYGEHTPLLVHTDLRLINASGSPMSGSLWSYQGINPRWGDHFNLLLTQNVVTGCAMAVNRPLLDMALPVPSEAVMHDWWLALVACAFGKVVWVPEASVLYRQHSGNVIGAKSSSFDPLSYGRYVDQIKSSLKSSAAQAEAFAKRFKNSPSQGLAQTYAALPQLSYGARRQAILKHRFFKSGRLKNLAWMAFA